LSRVPGHPEDYPTEWIRENLCVFTRSTVFKWHGCESIVNTDSTPNIWRYLNVKCILVYIVLGCLFFSATVKSSPRPTETVNRQLFKFSGTLSSSQRAGFAAGPVALHFSIYNEPNGGQAWWQETQNVDLDAQGHYTVLLGETGGAPSNFSSLGGKHWLGVQASGQPEEPRILLADLPAEREAIPINPSISITDNPTPYTATERYLALILSIMFLVGLTMASVELRKWWQTRTEVYGEPPFANLLGLAPDSEQLRRAARLIGRPLAMRFRLTRSCLQQSTQKIDSDEPRKAA
jgi:hypothetical protein